MCPVGVPSAPFVLEDGSVTTAKLADDAVINSKIANDAVKGAQVDSFSLIINSHLKNFNDLELFVAVPSGGFVEKDIFLNDSMLWGMISLEGSVNNNVAAAIRFPNGNTTVMLGSEANSHFNNILLVPSSTRIQIGVKNFHTVAQDITVRYIVF